MLNYQRVAIKSSGNQTWQWKIHFVRWFSHQNDYRRVNIPNVPAGIPSFNRCPPGISGVEVPSPVVDHWIGMRSSLCASCSTNLCAFLWFSLWKDKVGITPQTCWGKCHPWSHRVPSASLHLELPETHEICSWYFQIAQIIAHIDPNSLFTSIYHGTYGPHWTSYPLVN